MKALRLYPQSTEEEKRIMDTWFDDYNLDIDRFLKLAKDQRHLQSNINYVNTVLTSR